MKKNIILPVITVFICFLACTHKPEISLIKITTKDTTTTTNKTDSTTQQISDTSVCFQRDVLPIFLGSCAMSGCHSASSDEKGYNLTSYAHIVAKGVARGNSAGSILYIECTSGKMPKSPISRLDSTQLSYIRRWIDMGAPNDTNCAVICDTTKFTYTTAIVPLLKENCYSCHAATAAAYSGDGIVLDNYTDLLVQVGNGKLIGDLEHLSGHNPMPLGGAKLEDCQITQISKWIAAGAKNN